MRRIVKHKKSTLYRLKYKKNDTREIADILLVEQNRICAYTEGYIKEDEDLEEIEHFNPNLKDTDKDNYLNWFLVKAKINRRKGTRWFEPILHPTDENFETRIIYQEGEYLAKTGDIEAENLVKLLFLDSFPMTANRKRYIERMKEHIDDSKKPEQVFFDELINKYPDQVFYIRAIETEFGVKIKFPESVTK